MKNLTIKDIEKLEAEFNTFLEADKSGIDIRNGEDSRSLFMRFLKEKADPNYDVKKKLESAFIKRVEHESKIYDLNGEIHDYISEFIGISRSTRSDEWSIIVDYLHEIDWTTISFNSFLEDLSKKL